jgi:hypothetical protein
MGESSRTHQAHNLWALARQGHRTARTYYGMFISLLSKTVTPERPIGMFVGES